MAGKAQIQAGGDQDELRLIANWLRGEDEFRSQVQLVDGPAQVGRMGGVLDAIAIVVSSGGAGTVLIKSLFTYLGQRRRSVVLDLTLKREDGRELLLKLADAKTSDAIVEQAFQFFADPE